MQLHLKSFFWFLSPPFWFNDRILNENRSGAQTVSTIMKGGGGHSILMFEEVQLLNRSLIHICLWVRVSSSFARARKRETRRCLGSRRWSLEEKPATSSHPHPVPRLPHHMERLYEGSCHPAHLLLRRKRGPDVRAFRALGDEPSALSPFHDVGKSIRFVENIFREPGVELVNILEQIRP